MSKRRKKHRSTVPQRPQPPAKNAKLSTWKSYASALKEWRGVVTSIREASGAKKRRKK